MEAIMNILNEGQPQVMNDLKTIPSKETQKRVCRDEITGIEAIKKAIIQKKDVIIHRIINSNEWS